MEYDFEPKTLEEALASRDKWRSRALQAEDKEWTQQHDILEQQRLKHTYREALELIAQPKLPDGTYSLSREACEKLARDVLAT